MEEDHSVQEKAGDQEGNGDYVNHNARATPDEVRLGKFLHDRAKSGRLPGVNKVEGAPELPGQRSGDYRFTLDDGRVISADLYQPESTNARSIAANIIQKSGQAAVIVVELGRVESGQIGDQEATQVAQEVLDTPGHTINRIIIIRNDKIIVDRPRSG